MNPIIFCGYKHTGKTTCIKRLIGIIKKKGYSVATIKHIGRGHEPRLEDSDTTRYLKSGSDISMGFGGGYTIKYEIKAEEKIETKKFIRYKLHSLIMQSNRDFTLIEGFKEYDGPIPKIVFGNTKNEIESLIDELTVGYTGINAADFNLSIPYIPFDILDEKLFDFLRNNTIPFVADLDCGECGYPTCRLFAKDLLLKEVNIKSCVPMSSNIRLTINNKPVYLKGFVRDILKDVVIGFSKNLHDYEEGDIKIAIKRN